MTAPDDLLLQLRQTLGKLEIAMGAVPDAIAWAGPNRAVQWCNAAFGRLVKRGRLDALGSDLAQLLPLQRGDRIVEGDLHPFKKALDAGEAPWAAYGLRGRGGVELEVYAKRVEISPPASSVVVVARDVTDRQRAEEALSRRTEELARSNEELEQFAYVASHDLQEPLRKVRSYADLLLKEHAESLDPDGVRYLEHLANGTARMQDLVRDLLAYSRAGEDDTSRGPVTLSSVLRDVRADLDAAIRESGARFDVDPLPTVLASRTQMRQLLQNLIANAVKFRGRDRPLIRVSAERQGAKWRLSVSDNGIGIAAEHFERIFGVFERLHRREEYPGTGIGLAICRRIVKHHGGAIWVESQPGRGSTFHFTLPQAEP